jgi:DNA-binding NtrC family response regulator
MRAKLQSALAETYGWNVAAAADPELAAPLYATVDVVLSDWAMPKGGGARVLAECPRPVVVYSSQADIPHAFALRKPASLQRIHDMLLAAYETRKRK